MWIPFFLLIITVITARIKVPHPENLETQVSTVPEKLTKTFWLYNAFSITTTIGFISFVIIGYYFKDNNLLNDAQIPLLYSVAMGIDGAAALVVGKVYDNLKKRFNNERSGLRTLIVIPVLTILIPFLAFTKNKVLLIMSVLLWGIVMGTHETIMKSSIADLTHIKKRGTAYGIFNTGYGLALLISSSLIGLLYKVNIVYIYILVIVTQIISIVFYFTLVKSTDDRKNYNSPNSKV
jgi:MFS family permease